MSNSLLVDLSNPDNIMDQIADLKTLADQISRCCDEVEAVQIAAEAEMEVGDISMETCDRGLKVFRRLHKKTHIFNARQWITHVFMEQQLPEGMNEGNKC